MFTAKCLKEKKIYNEICNLNSFEYIDQLGLTTQDIENTLADSTLRVAGLDKSDFIENRVQLPIFATIFYYYVYTQKSVPTQEDFINFYISTYYSHLLTIVPKDQFKFLRYRISRAYTSILRDFYFYHLLKESGKFDYVLFNLKYDIEGKIDCFVQQNGQWFGLAMFTNTKRAWGYKNKKGGMNRPAIKTDCIEMELVLNLNEGKEVSTKGDTLKLYRDIHIQRVLEFIDSKQLKKAQ